MEYIEGTQNITQSYSNIVVLGNFDGVHLGHQALLKLAKEKQATTKLPIIVFSFNPHPTWVLGTNPKKLLSSRGIKKRKIEEQGIDTYIEYPFSESFAKITPEAFFKEILVDQLKARIVIVGSNYYFGKDKKGNIDYMKALGQLHGVDVCSIQTIKAHDRTISSTMIRQLIEDGELTKIKDFLGDYYKITGMVVHGKALGRTIGFPTANVMAKDKRVYPPNGVYATTIKVYNKEYLGITNIGFNPTVENTLKSIESHLFDFNEDIYGEKIEITFFEYIRAERKFDSLQQLMHQIEADSLQAKKILKNYVK